MTGEGQGLDLIKISVGNTCLLHTRLQSCNTEADLVNVKNIWKSGRGPVAFDGLFSNKYSVNVGNGHLIVII